MPEGVRDQGISIVLGVYNQAPLLARTLPEWHAIAAAYKPGSELIVCDDGSDDDTEALARDFAMAAEQHATPVRYLRQERGPRPRLAASLNSSLKHISHAYSLFAMGDSYPRDDLLNAYTPHLDDGTILSGIRLNVMEAFQHETVTPDYRLATTAYRHIHEWPRPWEGFTGNNFVIPTRMLHAVGGWNPGFEGYGAEDWELAMIAFYQERARFRAVPDAVVFHVEHPVREGSGDSDYFLAKWIHQLRERYASGDFDRDTSTLQPRP